jgi:predicted DNA-binding ribbon-helix-helix protein
MTALVKRSFSLAGHRTSVALEAEFWAALAALAVRRGQPLSALVSAIDATRDPARPLASALRVLALREAAPVAKSLFGHRREVTQRCTVEAGRSPPGDLDSA